VAIFDDHQSYRFTVWMFGLSVQPLAVVDIRKI
jgi:hypothetical protein